MGHDDHLYGKGAAPVNVLAGQTPPSAKPVAPTKPAGKAAPARAPVSDGSSQAPQMGDKQKIALPARPTIAASKTPARENNDRISGMVAAMYAEADRLYPKKGR